jgi:hypothetical protein
MPKVTFGMLWWQEAAAKDALVLLFAGMLG